MFRARAAAFTRTSLAKFNSMENGHGSRRLQNGSPFVSAGRRAKRSSLCPVVIAVGLWASRRLARSSRVSSASSVRSSTWKPRSLVSTLEARGTVAPVSRSKATPVKRDKFDKVAAKADRAASCRRLAKSLLGNSQTPLPQLRVRTATCRDRYSTAALAFKTK